MAVAKTTLLMVCKPVLEHGWQSKSVPYSKKYRSVQNAGSIDDAAPLTIHEYALAPRSPTTAQTALRHADIPLQREFTSPYAA
jgi:hypothetical protein